MLMYCMQHGHSLHPQRFCYWLRKEEGLSWGRAGPDGGRGGELLSPGCPGGRLQAAAGKLFKELDRGGSNGGTSVPVMV